MDYDDYLDREIDKHTREECEDSEEQFEKYQDAMWDKADAERDEQKIND